MSRATCSVSYQLSNSPWSSCGTWKLTRNTYGPGSDAPVSPISTPTNVSAADAVPHETTASRPSSDALRK